MDKKINLIRRIYRASSIEKIESKIKLFGISRKFTVEYFLNFRFFTSLFLFFAVLLSADLGFIYAPIVTGIYYYLLTYFMIEVPLKKRCWKLEREAFYYFEVLTLSLESGRNLEDAIEIACAYINSEVSNEFRETLYQVKFGKSLGEALSEMRSRIPSEVISNIILNITESNIFGNSILETMYNQLDFLRDKQVLDIKAEIAKIPNKISIFSVVFFVPLIMLLIIAPLVIDFLING